MILRPSCLLLWALTLLPPSVFADDASPFDCHIVVDNAKFDITSLAGEHKAFLTRSMPPSTLVQKLRFNLCKDLEKLEGVADQDQCESGTRACLTQVNHKPDEPDRVVSVIPLMHASSSNLTFKAGLSTSPKFISIISKGPEYPHPTDPKPTPQILNVTLLCETDGTEDPLLKFYDGTQTQVEWKTRAGCPLQGDDGNHDHKDDSSQQPGDEKKNESTGSGVGWFFLMLLLAFAAYFGLGAYYNYSTYGARGADLIPHRDFWKEVPYMLSDVVSHLCSSVRPRRATNQGYISV